MCGGYGNPKPDSRACHNELPYGARCCKGYEGEPCFIYLPTKPSTEVDNSGLIKYPYSIPAFHGMGETAHADGWKSGAEAQQAYDRQTMQGPSLEEVRQLLKLCEDILGAAEHGDYSSGNVAQGMDEGRVGFDRIFQGYKAKLQELTNLFDKYPKSEAKKGDTNVNR